MDNDDACWREWLGITLFLVAFWACVYSLIF